mgnify:CR=1 FL=1
MVTWGDFHEVEYGNESVTYAVGIGNCSTPDDVKLYDVGNATQVSFVGAAHSSNYCEIIPDVPAALSAAAAARHVRAGSEAQVGMLAGRGWHSQ